MFMRTLQGGNTFSDECNISNSTNEDWGNG